VISSKFREIVFGRGYIGVWWDHLSGHDHLPRKAISTIVWLYSGKFGGINLLREAISMTSFWKDMTEIHSSAGD